MVEVKQFYCLQEYSCNISRLQQSERGSFYWDNNLLFSPIPLDKSKEEHFYRRLLNKYWQQMLGSAECFENIL